MQRFSVVAIRDGGTGGAGGKGWGAHAPTDFGRFVKPGGADNLYRYIRALLDITSGLEVQQIFKIQTVRKPDIFLPRC